MNIVKRTVSKKSDGREEGRFPSPEEKAKQSLLVFGTMNTERVVFGERRFKWLTQPPLGCAHSLAPRTRSYGRLMAASASRT